MVRLVAATLALVGHAAHACTIVLVGKAASVDGAVLMATSCDGGIMGRVYVLPAAEYGQGSTVPMFYDFPAPSSWPQHLDQVQRGYTRVGDLPVQRTYRCVLAAGHLADSVTGGINSSPSSKLRRSRSGKLTARPAWNRSSPHTATPAWKRLTWFTGNWSTT
jgi:hypothetical protein